MENKTLTNLEEIIDSLNQRINECRRNNRIMLPTNLRLCGEVKGPYISITELEKVIDILKLPNVNFIIITEFLLKNPIFLICDLKEIEDIISFVFSNRGPRYTLKERTTQKDLELENHINSKIFKQCILKEFNSIIKDKKNYSLEMLAGFQMQCFKKPICDFNLTTEHVFDVMQDQERTPLKTYSKKMLFNI